MIRNKLSIPSVLLAAVVVCLAACQQAPTVTPTPSPETASSPLGASDQIACGHNLQHIALSPDGARLAAQAGTEVTLCAVQTKKVQLTLTPGNHPLMNIAWSPDGQKLATGTGDGHVLFWDAATGAQTSDLTTGDSAVYSLSWSADGLDIVTADGAMVRTWDVAAKKQLLALPHSNGSHYVAWSPDGKHIASAVSADIRIWNAGTGEEESSVGGPDSPGMAMTSIVWSSPSTYAAGFGYGVINAFDVSTGTQAYTLMLPDDHDATAALAWSPDGNFLAFAGSGGGLRLLETYKWQWHQVGWFVINGASDLGDVAWLPDGHRLLVLSGTADILLVDVGQAVRMP